MLAIRSIFTPKTKPILSSKTRKFNRSPPKCKESNMYNFKFGRDYQNKHIQRRRYSYPTNKNKFNRFIEENNIQKINNENIICDIDNPYSYIELVSHDNIDIPQSIFFTLFSQKYRKHAVIEAVKDMVIYDLPHDIEYDNTTFKHKPIATLYVHYEEVSDKIAILNVKNVGEIGFYTEGLCNQRYFARILASSKKYVNSEPSHI